jgi:YVTN family beta-propeller protein
MNHHRKTLTWVAAAASAALALGLSASIAGASTATPKAPAWNCTEPGRQPDAFAVNQGSDTVTPINTSTQMRAPHIHVGSGPVTGAVTPDAKTLYVVNQGSGNVSVIDTVQCNVKAIITVGSGPTAIAITPDGTMAYVVNEADSTVTPISTATNTAFAPIPVGTAPTAIAITPDGKTAYVADRGASKVTAIDTQSDTVIATINVSRGPDHIEITPDGRTAYVSDGGTSGLNNLVTPIDIATNTAGPAIPVGTDPGNSVITPDGAKEYVVNHSSQSVSVIRIADNTVSTPPIGVCADPQAITITPNGQKVYVTCLNANRVEVISTATNEVIKTIGVGIRPEDIKITVEKFALTADSGSNTATSINTTSDTVDKTFLTDTQPVAIVVVPPPMPPSPLFVVLKSATVGIGINQLGNLNVLNQSPSSGGTTTYGLRRLITNNEFTGSGCPCEGWGVVGFLNTTTSWRAWADQGTGSSNALMQLLHFVTTSNTATSTILIGPAVSPTLELINTYSQVPGVPDLWQDRVTIRNLNTSPMADIGYRRLVDWDIEPTAQRELVTIQGSGSPSLTGASFDGFTSGVSNDGDDSADPLSSFDGIIPPCSAPSLCAPLPKNTNLNRFGPFDQGAQFNLDLHSILPGGSLAPGTAISFNVYLGAAANQALAFTDLGHVGVQAYSLGEPSSTGDGSPNTAILGFSGIGGPVLTFPPLAAKSH